MNISLSQVIFNKPIHSLELSDLAAYFQNPKRETDTLEFKSYKDFIVPGTTKNSRDKDKISDLMRAICAFLNSDGGMLVWGAPEGKTLPGNSEEIYEGDLTPVSVKVEPDQFINRISSEISPTPLRILFQPIQITSDSFCYVFEVAKSEFSPHQYKGTYYIRLDGSTRPAPHHYVEALMKKITFPRLAGYLTFGEIKEYRNFSGIPLVLTLHNLSKFINEKNVQYRILAGCDIFNPNEYPDIVQLKYKSEIEKDAKKVLHCNMPYFDEFIIITDRFYNRRPANIDIILTFWGDLSPVIISRYNLQIFKDERQSTKYNLIDKNENGYLFEKQDQLSLNQVDSLNKSTHLLIESFEKRIHTFPLVKKLYE